jgi:hypothetical protein
MSRNKKDERVSLLKDADPIDSHDSSNDLEKGREIGEIFVDGLTTAEANRR